MFKYPPNSIELELYERECSLANSETQLANKKNMCKKILAKQEKMYANMHSDEALVHAKEEWNSWIEFKNLSPALQKVYFDILQERKRLIYERSNLIKFYKLLYKGGIRTNYMNKKLHKYNNMVTKLFYKRKHLLNQRKHFINNSFTYILTSALSD